MLESVKDLRDWNAWMENVKSIEGLTEIEKKKAIKALSLLRDFLGVDFLKEAFKDGHPIVHLLINYAPWTRKWLTWLANVLNTLKTCDKFEKVVKGLTSKNNYSSTIIEVDFAHRFSNSGFNVEFHPSIESGKQPDFKIVNPETSEKFYVEVASLGPSKYERDVSNAFYSIGILLFLKALPLNLDYTGRVYKYLSNLHLAEVLSKIENAINKANSEGFAETVENGTIELAIATKDNKALLERWACERGLKVGELIGPPIDINELLRLAGKINKEQRQLCKDSSNILIIRNPMFFFRTKDIRHAINFLEEYVYSVEHLAFCCIISTYLSIEERKQIVHDQHFYVKRMRENGIIEETLVLINRFIKDKAILLNSFSKIVKALTS